MKMSPTVSLEDLLREKVAKLDELKMATVLLGHKDALREQLSKAKFEMSSILKGMDAMRRDLEIMEVQNTLCRNLSTTLRELDSRIFCMEENVSSHIVQEFIRLNEDRTPYKKNSAVEANDEDSSENHIEDCKKTLFKNEEAYSMDPLSEEEFIKIPKYMIGRQSLATVNDLVTSINAILEGKYSVLALGKNGARKKGKLDLYLSLKRDEIAVGPGEDPIYFFTAEDYRRHTQTKLDKTKLNLLTVLRHCKRLRELRVGKNSQYVIIPTWERCKSG